MITRLYKEIVEAHRERPYGHITMLPDLAPLCVLQLVYNKCTYLKCHVSVHISMYLILINAFFMAFSDIYFICKGSKLDA